MAFTFKTSFANLASASLMLGALAATTGCSKAGDGPDASSAAGAKACCKGMNECRGKGSCAVEGKQSCAKQNECRGKGGCNGHCPK